MLFAEFCWPGVARHATHFLLLRQKKVSKEKATLLAASLRFATGNLRCSVQPGSKTTRFAQTSFCPDPSEPPLLGASTSGNRERGPNTKEKYQTQYNKDSPWRVLVSSGIQGPVFGCLVFGIPVPTPSGCAEERRFRRIRDRDCLSRRRVRARPRLDRAPQVARSEA